jgi:hypothetical protein
MCHSRTSVADTHSAATLPTTRALRYNLRAYSRRGMISSNRTDLSQPVTSITKTITSMMTIKRMMRMMKNTMHHPTNSTMKRKKR